ncbi:MAG: hypothetical protein ACAI44_28695, partial [Candidatus Sericytochromatia bacterium]
MKSKSRRFLVYLFVILFFIPSCVFSPLAPPPRSGQPDRVQEFRLQSTEALEPPPPQLAAVAQTPPNPDFELQFQT